MKKDLTIRFCTILCLITVILSGAKIHAQAVAYLESKERNEKFLAGLLVTPDGKYIIKSNYTAGSTNMIMFVSVFDIISSRMIRSMTLKGNGIPLRLTGNGKYIIFATNSNGSRVYQYIDFLSGKVVSEIVSGNQNLWASDIINDSTFLYSNHQVWQGRKLISPGNINFKSAPDGTFYARFIGRGDKFVTINGNRIFLWDVNSAEPLDSYDCGSALDRIEVAANARYFAACTKDKKSTTFYFTFENEKLRHWSDFPSSFHDIYFGLEYVYLVEMINLKKFRTRDGELLFDFQMKDYIKKVFGLVESDYSATMDLMLVDKLPGTEYLLLTDMQGVTGFYSTKTNNVTAYLYTWREKDYAFVTQDGRMEGTKTAMDLLRWVGGYLNVPLSSTMDQMYTPDLMKQYFTNTMGTTTVTLQNLVKFSPEIKITSPVSGSSTGNSTTRVSYEVKENGDEICKVKFFVNDKLINDDVRGMKAIGQIAETSVPLLPGKNTVKAVAITKSGYQSAPAEIEVTYTGATAEANLFILAVGIDQYKNTAYNLNYAVADAGALADKLRSSSKEIFKSINVYFYKNERAVRDSVIDGFNKISARSKPQDVVIFFYAGHGVMSEGSADVPKDFFLALHDVTQLYGNDILLQKYSISSSELKELSKKIAAQKQVIFLDACQSGAAIETFAQRGAAEEKAILQLARSTGSCMIASTGSGQYATEFKELGHGVFTYALLQGLDCKSPDSRLKQQVTIKDLEAFLNDYIPELTEKYHGTSQYPKSWSMGMDFPLTVCK